MPNKLKSNHTFLPVLDFSSSNSLYINCSKDIKNQNDYYGLDLLEQYEYPEDEEGRPKEIFVPPHQIHQFWCGSNKRRNCNCRHKANFGASKVLVRIECTKAHFGPISELATEAQSLNKTDLALDLLQSLSPQREVSSKDLALALTFPTLRTSWNKNIGGRMYIQTNRKKKENNIDLKVKELKVVAKHKKAPVNDLAEEEKEKVDNAVTENELVEEVIPDPTKKKDTLKNDIKESPQESKANFTHFGIELVNSPKNLRPIVERKKQPTQREEWTRTGLHLTNTKRSPSNRPCFASQNVFGLQNMKYRPVSANSDVSAEGINIVYTVSE